MITGLLLALLLAQAEVAPAAAPVPAMGDPAGSHSGPVSPPTFVALGIGVGRRSDPAVAEIEPTFGFSVGMAMGQTYATVGGLLELGGAFGFGYERYAKRVAITVENENRLTTVDDLRTLTHYDFSLLQTFALALAPVRPFAAVGAGIHLGHFTSVDPALRPGESRSTQPSLRAEIGADVAYPTADTRLGVALDYASLLGKHTFTTSDERSLQIFGDRLIVNLWLRHRF
jgi:hypothetical protein